MNQTALLVLSIFLTSLAKGECYREHLREAIALNTARAESYAKLTNGASRKVTNLMIQSESDLLAVSNWFNMDAWMKSYEDAGVKVMCDSFISMSKVPEFKKKFPQGPVPLENLHSIKDLKIGREMLKTYFFGSDADLLNLSTGFIKTLEKEPRIYCMTRHLLESVARSASLIPIHAEQARQKNLSSPRWAHRTMILGQIALLYKTIQIDEEVKPINTAGVPMICQDVPPIPIAN